jgi:hypothetical protein
MFRIASSNPGSASPTDALLFYLFLFGVGHRHANPGARDASGKQAIRINVNIEDGSATAVGNWALQRTVVAAGLPGFWVRLIQSSPVPLFRRR